MSRFLRDKRIFRPGEHLFLIFFEQTAKIIVFFAYKCYIFFYNAVQTAYQKRLVKNAFFCYNV